MLARVPRCSAVAIAALLVFAPAAAHGQQHAPAPCTPVPAPAGVGFDPGASRNGVVDLIFGGAPGASVAFFECYDGHATPLGSLETDAGGSATLAGAVPWSCTRTTRAFAAVETLPGGGTLQMTSNVRTPSCRLRFGLLATPSVQPGRRARIRIVDHWAVGGADVRLCVTPPGASRTCGTRHFKRGVVSQLRLLRPRTRGIWRLDLAVDGRYHVAQRIAVGVKAPPVKPLPVLLATGDSSMQGVAGALDDDLADLVDVAPDFHLGYALSDRDADGLARSEIARYKPQTVVLSLGLAEGFPMTAADGASHDCCDSAWVAEYVRRLGALLDIYAQHGRAHIYELTVTTPRDPRRAAIVAAVNQAIVTASAGRPDVTVVRIDKLLSPDGYAETVVDSGRTVAIREPDGIHLNAAGTAIEAREVARIIRADAAKGR